MNGYFPSEQDLNNLCTSNCLSSLQDLRSQQIQGCTAEDIITTGGGGQEFPPTLTLDQLIFTYTIPASRTSMYLITYRSLVWTTVY